MLGIGAQRVKTKFEPRASRSLFYTAHPSCGSTQAWSTFEWMPQAMTAAHDCPNSNHYAASDHMVEFEGAALLRIDAL